MRGAASRLRRRVGFVDVARDLVRSRRGPPAFADGHHRAPGARGGAIQ
jgi:hypothetical protein